VVPAGPNKEKTCDLERRSHEGGVCAKDEVEAASMAKR